MMQKKGDTAKKKCDFVVNGQKFFWPISFSERIW